MILVLLGNPTVYLPGVRRQKLPSRQDVMAVPIALRNCPYRLRLCRNRRVGDPLNRGNRVA